FIIGEKAVVRPSVLERLKERNPNLELWWDAHPGFFRAFLARLKEKGFDSDSLDQMKKWMSHNEGGFFFFDGVTTNPPLVLKFLQTFPQVVERVREWGKGFQDAESGKYSWFDLYWMVGKLGTDKFLSNFYRRGRQFGFVCVQVDPRHSKDQEIMKFQALKLARISPNVMIKIPATRAGILVIEELVSLGIPVNVTSCFCVPQVVHVARAIKKGVEKGRIRGIDYSGWRSVITMMIGRWETSPELGNGSVGVSLREEELRWFGILMAQRAVEEVKVLQAPTKVLVCSTRKGPGNSYLHLEELSKLPIVITMNPEAIEWGVTLLREERTETPLEVPAFIQNKLYQIDFAKRSLITDGFSMEEIEASGAQKYNLNEFSEAMDKVEKILR
ncbi:MAG: transaldolase family protein, partial [Candidatus Caldatribacteriaceae bacterium]